MNRLLRLRAAEVNQLRRALQYYSKGLLAEKQAASDEAIKKQLQDAVDQNDRLADRLLRGDNK